MLHKTDYIFGLRAIIEAIEAGRDVDKVLLRKDLAGGELSRQLMQVAKEYGIPTQRVPLEKLNRITMKNHQGAIALMSAVPYHSLDQLLPGLYEEGALPFLVLLDGVTDVRNFGAICRTAECAGANAVIIPEHGSATPNADAMKTSAGALTHLPVCRVRSLGETINYLQQSGVTVVGASEKASQSYTAMPATGPIAIVMGAEDTGLSPEVLRTCDHLASIPILGSISSLNVSVAAGVMLYEVVRQRLETGTSPK